MMTKSKASIPNNLRGALAVLGALAIALLLGTLAGPHTRLAEAQTAPWPKGVWAWGSNSLGELGIGTSGEYDRRVTPVQSSGMSGATDVSGGDGHSLALKNDGTVWAWGYNWYGQLGDGTTQDRSTPVQVNGLTGAKAISAGGAHSLALKNDGTVWAWGKNLYGELGDGTTSNTSTPVQVKNLSGVTAVAAGNHFSLAVRNDGTVWAWGNNHDGQLGDGTTDNRSIPVQVKNLSGATAVAAGGAGSSHSLALKNDGTVRAWGFNSWGQLGDGTTDNRSTPVQVKNLSGVTDIAAGLVHSLAVKNDGTVWAWGHNWYGELGDGTQVYKPTPVQANNLIGATQVSGGDWYSLAVAQTVDTQAPTTTASTSPDPNPSGWSNQDVTLSFRATDNQGGWGVKEIRYQATGAQPIPQTLYAPSNPPVISIEGTTQITYFAIDYAGNKEASKTLTVKLDKSAPDAPAITSPANGYLDADGSFTIRGTAEANGTVEIFEVTTSGTTSIVGTTSVDSSGTWSKTFSSVPNGSHAYEAEAKDAAGNTSGFSNTRTVIVDTIAPSVRRVVPVEDATGIAPGANVSARFSEAMRVTSVKGAFKLYKKGSTTALRARVTYDAASKKAVLNPSAKLERRATYKAVITTGAKDLAGNALDQDQSLKGSQQKVWFFKISA